LEINHGHLRNVPPLPISPILPRETLTQVYGIVPVACLTGALHAKDERAYNSRPLEVRVDPRDFAANFLRSFAEPKTALI